MRRTRSVAFDRALQVEMLRARAAIERQAISNQASRLCQSLDPREQLANFIPRSASGALGQLSQLIVRYPLLLSSGASLVTSQLRRPKRLLMAGAAGLAIWLLNRKSSADDQ